MNVGPCIYCGVTNYASSMGGPHICPSCDSGAIPRAGHSIPLGDALFLAPTTSRALHARIEALEQALRGALPILEESYRWHRDAQSHAAIIMRACRAVETARAALAQTGEPIE
jgi:hypothetical protein